MDGYFFCSELLLPPPHHPQDPLILLTSPSLLAFLVGTWCWANPLTSLTLISFIYEAETKPIVQSNSLGFWGSNGMMDEKLLCGLPSSSTNVKDYYFCFVLLLTFCFWVDTELLFSTSFLSICSVKWTVWSGSIVRIGISFITG